MPQANFQVIGKYIDAEGNRITPGSLVSLETGEDDKPLDGLLASRVRPFRGELPDQGSDGEGDPKGAKAKARKIIDEAKAEATKLIDEAKAEATKLIDEASTQAQAIIEAAKQA